MGDSIGLKTAIPLIISNRNYNYYFYLDKYLEKMKNFLRLNKNITEDELTSFSENQMFKYKISSEKNLDLYTKLNNK